MSDTTLIIISISFIWFVSGIIGPIHEWTKEWDLKLSDLPLIFLLGVFAPAGWIIGIISLLGDSNLNPPIFKKRNKKD